MHVCNALTLMHIIQIKLNTNKELMIHTRDLDPEGRDVEKLI